METLDRAAPTPSAAADKRYEVIEGDLERDRETVIGIWRSHIGWQDQLDRMYDVFYLHCPFGRPLLRLLRHWPSGDIVGTIGAGPRPMLWQGRELRAAVISHFAVLPGHRSLKPALGLARAMAAASADRFEAVYGLPNANSGAIGKRAGFKVPGQLLRHVKVLRYRNYLPRVLPGMLGQASGALLDSAVAAGRRLRGPGHAAPHATWVDAVDPRMQALWEGSDLGTGLSTIRTSAMLEWRLLGLPSVRRRFLLVSPARGAPLTAWFACETNVRAPQIMTVTDAWFAGGVHGIDRRAVRALCRMAYDAGFDAMEMRLTASAPVLDAWRAEGFVTRGRQPLFIVWMDPQLDGDIGAGMHITDIEQDG